MNGERIETQPAGCCPVCDMNFCLNNDIEESEIVTCPDCFSPLVVSEVCGCTVQMEEAPAIEEDWGE